ncbi:MAG: hypothetical protein ACOYJ1_08530 [Peptococcales bacterium]
MHVLLASFSASMLALFFNRFVVSRWGDFAISVIVPIAEELLKTLLGVFFGASIFYTHFGFGVIEAMWDMKVNPKGFRPAVFSLITHSFFGFVTLYAYYFTGFLLIGIITGSIFHIFWNSYIIKYSERVKE